MIRSGVPEEGRTARLDNFVNALLSCDILVALDYLDSVFLYLIGREANITGFKHLSCLSLSGDDVSSGLLSPINCSLYSFLSETVESSRASLLPDIAQFLRFPLKLNFQGINLENDALADYLRTEANLPEMTSEVDDIADELASIIHEWFSEFRIEFLRPSHGPGSVAEGPLDLTQKFQRLGVDNIMKMILSGPVGTTDYREYYPIPPTQVLNRVSRTVFVPKTASKLRTISMEPVSLQYIQQGVMKELYRFIENHPYLGMRVRLDDQGQNQLYAWEGSKYGTFSTIDLSHASDSVSWALVRRVFKRTPHLLKWFLACRSRETCLPGGCTMRLKKFAPMGSALCFPVECIIFASIVEYASRKFRTHRRYQSDNYAVYGDDLVVPTRIFHSVKDALERCGFEVNRRKSYHLGPYRESCGKDYYGGVDTSSLYYRVPLYLRGVTPGAYGSWCTGANNALMHRLPLLRLHYITLVKAAHRRWGPYFCNSADASPYLFSSQPTNFHVQERWNRNYQRWEGRFTSVMSRQRDSELADDALRYHCRLVEMSWRDRKSSQVISESLSPIAMRGCVEFFSSTVRPITPYLPSWKIYEVRSDT